MNDSEIEVKTLMLAAEMSGVNHVPACNCDVCAFKNRILKMAETIKLNEKSYHFFKEKNEQRK